MLGNDTLNAATLTTGAFATTAGGSVTLSADGGFAYTPPANTATVDTFRYTLTNIAGSDSATVTITSASAPIAVDDSAYQAAVNTTLTVPAPGVLGNDTVNVATISAYDAVTARGGTVTLNADGSFSYTPPTDAFSPPDDTFTYILTNGRGSDTATVTIAILPPPIANDDGPYNTPENTPLIVNAASGVLTNDTVNGATISAYDATASDGGAVVVNADGSFSYTPPNAAYNGIDTFTYTLSNVSGNDSATVTIHVGAAPDAVADGPYQAARNTVLSIPAPGVLANDDVNNGALTTGTFATTQGGSVIINADGSFDYTPATDFVSPPNDTFSYTLTNELGFDSATVMINVVPPPVATDDGPYSTPENTPLTVTAPGVLGNDTVNGATIDAYDARPHDGGTVVRQRGRQLHLHAAVRDLRGLDTFTYTLTNASGPDSATVTINVGTAPDAVDDSYSTRAQYAAERASARRAG